MSYPLPKNQYDVLICGAGHNGLIAACYLAQHGLSVAILEQQATSGGTAVSRALFEGVDVQLSAYAYLLGMMPESILADLNLDIQAISRDPGVFLPYQDNGAYKGLLFTENAIASLTNFDNFPDGQTATQELQHFRALQHHLGTHLWPTLLQPLQAKRSVQALFQSDQEKQAWQCFIERPVGEAIETILSNDFLRGLVCTDAVIGTFSHPHDASLTQNRTFLYHSIANGTGDWRVPVGGMGALAKILLNKCQAMKVDILNNATVARIYSEPGERGVSFVHQGKNYTASARYALVNLAPRALAEVLPGYQPRFAPAQDQGCFVKINMVLNRLPKLKCGLDASLAFTGTFHINEGYANLRRSYEQALAGIIPHNPPGELYCHSLSDRSIVAAHLGDDVQTLTLFGLMMPYQLFVADNEGTKAIVLQRYLEAINEHLVEPIENCIAKDVQGKLCIQMDSPLDIERKLGIPSGHVFHHALTWPFAESEEEIGSWGVDTGFPGVFLCGAGARRGGCISGIPGHNAAMQVLALEADCV